MSDELMYQPDPKEYTHWWRVLKDFALKPTADTYQVLVVQRVIDSRRAIMVYLSAMIPLVVVLSILARSLESDLWAIFPMPWRQPEDFGGGWLGEMIFTGIIFVLIYIIHQMIFIGISHFSASMLFGSAGDYDRLAIGFFFSLAIFASGILVVVLLVAVFAQLGEDIFPLLKLVAQISLGGIGLYLLYCYTLWAKLAYRLPWLPALIATLGVPVAVVGGLVYMCVMVWGAS